MYSIRIIGAGSIGNHLAHAARTRGWNVTLTDIDPDALERAQDDIYPGRYGAWDDNITLKLSQDAADDPADVVFVGTPPDSHVAIALDALERVTPKMLLVEKPLAGPDLDRCDALLAAVKKAGTFGSVGYNHCLGQNTVTAERFLKEGRIGQVLTITTKTREHWQGIFNAHPWLSGPSDSYLGFSSRGGGATGEHSHAINIWQHFAHLSGAGRVTEVSAMLDRMNDGGVNYDRAAFISLRTENGMVGDVVQDVVTQPAEKSARLQGENGHIEWLVNAQPGKDLAALQIVDGDREEVLIEKTRPDDFIAEIDHLAGIMDGSVTSSPISLERGLDTLMVIAAVFRSDELGRRVKIDWSRGYNPDAIV
ncbi:MAG: Gfo/Idh/MocA family oxidoreductase [Pseudomonadota bacterium]